MQSLRKNDDDALTSKSATELIDLIKTRAISNVEVVESFLRRIEQINPSLNAIITISPDVLDRARAQQARGNTGPLHGLPITVKDTIDTEGIRTTYGSRLFAEHVPDCDAAVVARLKAAGAMVLGKTNTPEMAIPYETNNALFGRTNNPHNLTRTAGGSSGGEAAALASSLSPAGVGSDLSGSIRVPAHFCGIASLKPTAGAVSMDGHLPRAYGTLSLGASIGPMARYVRDLALLFKIMSETSVPGPDDRRVRVRWYVDDAIAPVSSSIVTAVTQVAEILHHSGCDVHQETPPGIAEGQRLWIELFSRAAEEQIQNLYRGREQFAGPRVTSALRSRGASTFEDKVTKAEQLAKAVVERERLREDLLRWLKPGSVILSPVCATTAFKHGAERLDVNGQSISVFRSCSYAQTVNVFGLPAATVPVAHDSEGLPISVQIVGRPFAEETVLSVAQIIEDGAGFF
jgi:Asp-tRNA(Asn)/Glu-tRNA(Gln) amidotransferase A subunit family amidase